MSKDPAVLFYTADFLTGTFTMTNDQVGKYIRLLCLQHQKGMLTDKDMLNICKSYDEEVYSKFVKKGSEYYNKRMRDEAEKRKKYSESRSANRSAKPNNKGKGKGKKISKTYVKHMEDEIEDEVVIKNEIVYPFDSENFIKIWEYWKMYKKDQHDFKYKGQISEQAALKGLGELSEQNEEMAIKIIIQSIENGWKGLFKIKEDNNGKRNTKGVSAITDQRLAEILAEVWAE